MLGKPKKCWLFSCLGETEKRSGREVKEVRALDKIKIKDLKGKKQTNRNYIGIVYYRKKKIE